MEKNGDFIESGTYNSHYYGTLKPKVNIKSTKELSTMNKQEDSSQNTETINVESNSEITINGDVIVHQVRNGEVGHDNREDSQLNEDENSSDKHFTQL